LSDGTSLTVRIQLYGGIWRFNEGEFYSKYYLVVREKPAAPGDEFNEAYFFLDMLGC